MSRRYLSAITTNFSASGILERGEGSEEREVDDIKATRSGFNIDFLILRIIYAFSLFFFRNVGAP
eukprot:1124662-Amorphochlora_amoeboformis.AAC.2